MLFLLFKWHIAAIDVSGSPSRIAKMLQYGRFRNPRLLGKFVDANAQARSASGSVWEDRAKKAGEPPVSTISLVT